MQDMFPGVVLEELDTGHWVHSEACVSISVCPFFASSWDLGLENSSKQSINTLSEWPRQENQIHFMYAAELVHHRMFNRWTLPWMGGRRLESWDFRASVF